jgi:hypothetical protein
MGLNFVDALPDDDVQPRSTHSETARLLRENPTSTGWADISPEGGYSKRATATAFAKGINDHTHESYRDYGYEAVVRSRAVYGEDGKPVMVDEKDKDGKVKSVPKQEHLLFARYNPSLPNAGTLAPVPEKATSAPEAADKPADEPEAPAPASELGNLSSGPVTSVVDGKGQARTRPAARAK